LAGFVVSAQDGDALRVANLKRNEKRNCFDGVVATVDIVAYRRYQSMSRTCGERWC
jgi:hypothetical protein